MYTYTYMYVYMYANHGYTCPTFHLMNVPRSFFPPLYTSLKHPQTHISGNCQKQRQLNCCINVHVQYITFDYTHVHVHFVAFLCAPFVLTCTCTCLCSLYNSSSQNLLHTHNTPTSILLSRMPCLFCYVCVHVNQEIFSVPKVWCAHRMVDAYMYTCSCWLSS